MLLINFEISLTLTCSENCNATRNVVPVEGGNPAVAAVNNPTGATFKITDTKLYVPVVTLSTKDDNKLLKTAIRNRI